MKMTKSVEQLLEMLPEEGKRCFIVDSGEYSKKEVLDIAEHWKQKGQFVKAAIAYDKAREYKKGLELYKRALEIGEFGQRCDFFIDDVRSGKIKDIDEIEFFSQESEKIFANFNELEKKFLNNSLNLMTITKYIGIDNMEDPLFGDIEGRLFKYFSLAGFPLLFAGEIIHPIRLPEDFKKEYRKKWGEDEEESSEESLSSLYEMFKFFSTLKKEDNYPGSNELEKLLIENRKFKIKMMYQDELRGSLWLKPIFEDFGAYRYAVSCMPEIRIEDIFKAITKEGYWQDFRDLYSESADEYIDKVLLDQLLESRKKYKDLYDFLKTKDLLK